MRVTPRLVAGILLALLAGVFIACGRGPFNPSWDKSADKDYGPPPFSDKEGKDKVPPAGGDPSELKVTPIALDAAGLLPCISWTDGLWIANPVPPPAKGTAFYALDGKRGLLHRLSGPGYKTPHRGDLGRPVNWLAQAPGRLVVTVADANEFWLVDPTTLQMTKKVPFQGQGLKRAVSSQILNFVAAGFNNGDDLMCVDLLRGDQVHVKLNLAELQRGAILDPVMPDNDSHLFTRTVGGRVVRWICGGGIFEMIDRSPPVPGADSFSVSADGRRVCVSGAGGTNVYSLPGFKPAYTLTPNPHPAPVGFDPNGDAYSGGNGTLVVFNSGGQKFREYKVGKGNVRQILVHPDGRKLLLLQEGQLSFVEVNLRLPPD
jgi:hypothetical protein